MTDVMFDLPDLKMDYFLSFPLGYLQLASSSVLASDSSTDILERENSILGPSYGPLCFSPGWFPCQCGN